MDALELIEQKCAEITNGTGYGEVRIVIMAGRIETVKATETHKIDNTKK